MAIKTFFTGDTIPIDAILKINGVAIIPSPDWSVRVAILDAKKDIIAGPVNLGWSGDHAVGYIPGTLTAFPRTPSPSAAAATTAIPAYIEIETLDPLGNKQTYGQEAVQFIFSPSLFP
jgi:hypothetical protein